jgi:hypothetical protein
MKIQETCKLFLIVLEDYLRFTFWTDYYNENTNYSCFEIFKDYYEDANFYIDRNKLFKIEEDIWMTYSSNVIMIEENPPTMFNMDNYGFHCNFLPYDEMDLDFNDEVFQVIKPKEYESYSVTGTLNTYQEKQSTKSSKKSVKKQPAMKDLIIKFTKRENVDKKILRKFRKFLKDLSKKNKLPVTNDFWTIFVHENLLPPVQYNNSDLGEEINFKSFNTTYMLWLFSHDSGIELYDLFLDQKMIQVYEMFTDIVKTQQDDAELKNYIKYFAHIYSCKEQQDDTISTVPLYVIQEEINTELEKENSNESFQYKKVYDVVFDIE